MFECESFGHANTGFPKSKNGRSIAFWLVKETIAKLMNGEGGAVMVEQCKEGPSLIN